MNTRPCKTQFPCRSGLPFCNDNRKYKKRKEKKSREANLIPSLNNKTHKQTLFSLCTLHISLLYKRKKEKYNMSLETEITRKFSSQSPVIVKFQ